MKRSGRCLTVATTVAAMAMSLAACGGGSSDSSADGTVTIRVQAWKGGGAEPANVAEINKAFEKANPKIKVDFEYITANDTYTQKLQPELLGGKAGDVIMVDTDRMKKWGASGYLADLSGESWASRIAPDAKPFAQSDGKTLAMPMELIGIGMYANMDLLKKAGITEVPADWPTFLADLAKLKKAGIDPISLPDKGAWTGASVFQAASTDPGLPEEQAVGRRLPGKQDLLRPGLEGVAEAVEDPGGQGVPQLEDRTRHRRVVPGGAGLQRGQERLLVPGRVAGLQHREGGLPGLLRPLAGR